MIEAHANDLCSSHCTKIKYKEKRRLVASKEGQVLKPKIDKGNKKNGCDGSEGVTATGIALNVAAEWLGMSAADVTHGSCGVVETFSNRTSGAAGSLTYKGLGYEIHGHKKSEFSSKKGESCHRGVDERLLQGVNEKKLAGHKAGNESLDESDEEDSRLAMIGKQKQEKLLIKKEDLLKRDPCSLKRRRKK
jgi:hypothetical protein